MNSLSFWQRNLLKKALPDEGAQSEYLHNLPLCSKICSSAELALL